MTLPALFVSHGSPMLAITPSAAHEFLRELSGSLARPDALVVASPHFPALAPTVVADPRPEMIYDFRGFPPELSKIVYPAPGEPDLARDVAKLLGGGGFEARTLERRGYDHGIWVPLSLIWPEADIPIVQLSIQPRQDAAYHRRLGAALRPLLDRNVMVIGTGAITHNLGELMSGGLPELDAEPEEWAVSFADWLAERAADEDHGALTGYRAAAPAAARAHPEDDHLLPFFVALGAAGPNARGERIHRSIEYGALAMDAYLFSAAA